MVDEKYGISLPRRPIAIEPYNSSWPELFKRESKEIKQILGDFEVVIEHVGSTAVPGMSGKPTVDIAVGCACPIRAADALVTVLEQSGYCLISGLINYLPGRKIFWKGTQDTHLFHVHLIKTGDKDWCELLAFRDHLLNNPNDRDLYAEEKKRLARFCKDNIALYIRKKSGLYNEILNRARAT